MSQGMNIYCDICNKSLAQNEIGAGKGMFGFGENPNKPAAKNRFQLKIDNLAGQPKDICFSCARKIRDYIEKLKP